MPCRRSSSPAPTPSMSCSARPIPISCGIMARPIAKAWSRARADLGIADHVVFLDQFVDQATLLDFISMCDVYVTPYLNEAQMTSGTLAYSFGLGKAVVSTPYWHAQELLADGRGILVPFGDAAAIGAEISGLLTDDVRRHAMRKRAYAASRSMTWAQTAERYLTVFESGVASQPLRQSCGRLDPIACSTRAASAAPEMRDRPFPVDVRRAPGCSSMPSIRVPDRAHGYCVDDNARALLLACALDEPRRAAPARDADRALCGLRPARLEPRHPALPQLHELRPALAGGRGLGGQPRPHALGAWANARATTPIRRAADGPPRCSTRRLPAVETFHLAARLGLHAAGAGRLLRVPSAETSSPTACACCWPTG